MLKTSIKDKLVLRFSSACFEPHFCHVIEAVLGGTVATSVR
jgi:hypothetical protein